MNIIYNYNGSPTQVNIFLANSFSCEGTFRLLAEKFNGKYAGKIQINISNEIVDNNQDLYPVRIQQTPELNRTYSAYYPANDVFALAGLTIDQDDFYEKASRENFIYGTQYSVPLIGMPNYLVYNKVLLNKYNTLGHLPSNYNEFSQVLSAAYQGEKANTSFRSISASGEWMFKESAAQLTFFQNDAPAYVYDATNNEYKNTWVDGSTDYNNALKAVDAREPKLRVGKTPSIVPPESILHHVPSEVNFNTSMPSSSYISQRARRYFLSLE